MPRLDARLILGGAEASSPFLFASAMTEGLLEMSFMLDIAHQELRRLPIPHAQWVAYIAFVGMVDYGLKSALFDQ